MKIKKLIATAGLIAAALGSIGIADAQRHDDHNRDRYEHRGDRYDRHDNRGHHYGRDRQQRCRTEYRHHRRVRICR